MEEGTKQNLTDLEENEIAEAETKKDKAEINDSKSFISKLREDLVVVSFDELSIYEEHIFNKCINVVSNKREALKDSYLSDLKNELEIKLKTLDTYYKEKSKEIDFVIEAHKSQFETLERERHEELPILQNDLDKLDTEFLKVSQKLSEKRIEHGALKDQLSEKIIENAGNNFEKLKDYNLKIYKDRIKEKQELSKNNQRKAKKIVQLEKDIENTENRLNKIVEKTERLNIDGINPVVYNVLIWIAFTGAFAAGWLFSVFALEYRLNSENTPFFIIKRLIQFGDNLGLTQSWLNPLIAFGVWCSILIILTILFKLVNPKTRFERIIRDNKNHLNHSFSETESASHLNSFNFWLQFLPFIFIAGLLFIVFSISGANSDGEDLKRLDVALSSQVIGSTLALCFFGLAYLYVLKIVENRLNETNVIKRNIEVFILMLLFVFGILLVVSIVLLDKDKTLVSNGIIALILFILVSLISSFAFGYGYRYRGLIRTEHYYNRLLHFLKFSLEKEIGDLEEKTHEYEESLHAKYNSIFNQATSDYIIESHFRKRIREDYINESIPQKSVESWFAKIKNPISLIWNYLYNNEKNVSKEEVKKDHLDTSKKHLEPVGYEDLDTQLLAKNKVLENRIIAEIHILENEKEQLKNRITQLKSEIDSIANRKEIKEIKSIIQEKTEYKNQLIKEIEAHKDLISTKFRKVCAAIENGYELSRWYQPLIHEA
jgi:hypothetical protein